MAFLSTSSRRDFVKTLSVGLAAGVAAGGRHSASPAIGSEKKSLGFAVVGLGNVSTQQIAPSLLKARHCHLAGIVTGTPEKKKVWGETYRLDSKHIYSYQDFDKLIDDDSIDVVYIALPNSLHEEFTIRAATAGKHVLCERPMASSAAEGRRMLEACQSASRQLAIGYRGRLGMLSLPSGQLLRQNELGAIQSIEASFGYVIGDPAQWRLRRALSGGGALMDAGIEAVQACRSLAGEEPISVTAQETKTDADKFAEVDESMVWAMNFPSGLVAHCTTTLNHKAKNWIEIQSERGMIRLGSAVSREIGQAKNVASPFPLPVVDRLAAEMDEFALSIMEHRCPEISGEEGLRDLQLVEAIYRSAREGTTVSLA